MNTKGESVKSFGTMNTFIATIVQENTRRDFTVFHSSCCCCWCGCCWSEIYRQFEHQVCLSLSFNCETKTHALCLRGPQIWLFVPSALTGEESVTQKTWVGHSHLRALSPRWMINSGLWWKLQWVPNIIESRFTGFMWSYSSLHQLTVALTSPPLL